MVNPFEDAATFLIGTLFGLYTLLVMLRFLFQLVRADFYNPISQFLVAWTNPPLRPLRRFIPSLYGLDTSTLVLMFALKYVEIVLIHQIRGWPVGMVGVSVLAVAGLLLLAVYVFLGAILVRVVISWIAPGVHNPINPLLRRLTDPVLRPARKLTPAGGGLDLSPLIASIALILILILVVTPLQNVAQTLL